MQFLLKFIASKRSSSSQSIFQILSSNEYRTNRMRCRLLSVNKIFLNKKSITLEYVGCRQQEVFSEYNIFVV